MRMDKTITIALVTCTIIGAFIGGYMLGHDEATAKADEEFPYKFQQNLEAYYLAMRELIGPNLHLYVTPSGRYSISNHCPAPGEYEEPMIEELQGYRYDGDNDYKPLIG